MPFSIGTFQSGIRLNNKASYDKLPIARSFAYEGKGRAQNDISSLPNIVQIISIVWDEETVGVIGGDG